MQDPRSGLGRPTDQSLHIERGGIPGVGEISRHGEIDVFNDTEVLTDRERGLPRIPLCALELKFLRGYVGLCSEHIFPGSPGDAEQAPRVVELFARRSEQALLERDEPGRAESLIEAPGHLCVDTGADRLTRRICRVGGRAGRAQIVQVAKAVEHREPRTYTLAGRTAPKGDGIGQLDRASEVVLAGSRAGTRPVEGEPRTQGREKRAPSCSDLGSLRQRAVDGLPVFRIPPARDLERVCQRQPGGNLLPDQYGWNEQGAQHSREPLHWGLPPASRTLGTMRTRASWIRV